MSVSVEEFQALQEQLIELKTKNYELKNEMGKDDEQMKVDALISANKSARGAIKELNKELQTLKYSMKLQGFIDHINQNQITEIPDGLMSKATQLYEAIETVKQQVTRRAFLDTQASEINKKTKSLSRADEQLQNEISGLRHEQAECVESFNLNKGRIEKLEGEANELRKALAQAIKPSKLGDEIDDLEKENTRLETELREREEQCKTTKEKLEADIAELERRIEDLSSVSAITEKKTQQKIKAMQDEINKRRGIVVHASKGIDPAELFIESKDLIEELRIHQEKVWELEERVPFTKVSLDKMADELIKALFGIGNTEKEVQMKTVSKSIVLKIAENERMSQK